MCSGLKKPALVSPNPKPKRKPQLDAARQSNRMAVKTRNSACPGSPQEPICGSHLGCEKPTHDLSPQPQPPTTPSCTVPVGLDRSPPPSSSALIGEPWNMKVFKLSYSLGYLQLLCVQIFAVRILEKTYLLPTFSGERTLRSPLWTDSAQTRFQLCSCKAVQCCGGALLVLVPRA